MKEVVVKKDTLKAQIAHLLSNACTKNIVGCPANHCKIMGTCFLSYVNEHGWPKKKTRLKSIAKSIVKNSNREKGRKNPSFLGNNILEIASTCLGQNIYEHELVKGYPIIEKQISVCTTLSQIVAILDRNHVAIHGKSKLWHYRFRN
jgi:hypothetical protein